MSFVDLATISWCAQGTQYSVCLLHWYQVQILTFDAKDPVLTAMSPQGKYAICRCMHSCACVMMLMFLSFSQNDGIHILYMILSAEIIFVSRKSPIRKNFVHEHKLHMLCAYLDISITKCIILYKRYYVCTSCAISFDNTLFLHNV